MQDDLNNPKSIKTNLNNLLISTGSPAFVEKNQGMRKDISVRDRVALHVAVCEPILLSTFCKTLQSCNLAILQEYVSLRRKDD